MTTRSCLAWALCAGAVALLGGCGGKEVTRHDPDKVIDKSGYWNDSDHQLAAKQIVAGMNARPAWATDFRAASKGRQPCVRFDRIIVRADSDQINTAILKNKLKFELINSGLASVYSDREEASTTRAEIADQQENATAESKKAARQETGVDFLLTGEINAQNDTEGKEQVRAYFIDMVLTNVQSRQQVWMGRAEIKKEITGASMRP